MVALTRPRLHRLLADIGHISKLDDWDPEQRWSALQLCPAAGRARRTLLVTKLAGLIGVALHRLPSSVALLAHYGVPSRSLCARIARECSAGRLDFVGDLDPLDLTVYAALASRLREYGVAVRHCGVNATWLGWCKKQLRPRWNKKLPTITMDTAQRKHFELLRALPLPWERIIGASALELLEHGEKLELEGATNPGFYRPALTRDIERHVLRI